MTEPVVIQSRDRTGRTILSWFEDTHEAERHRPLAWVGSGQLHIEEEAPPEVGQRATNLFHGELVQDPWCDLDWLATHVRDADGIVKQKQVHR